MYRKFVDIAPFIMLFATAILGVFAYFESYSVLFKYLSDVLGYSLFTNVIMLRIYRSKRYCDTTRIAVYGLIAMNLVSLITLDTIYYNRLNDVYITIVVSVVVLHSIKKK